MTPARQPSLSKSTFLMGRQPSTELKQSKYQSGIRNHIEALLKSLIRERFVSERIELKNQLQQVMVKFIL